MVNKALHPDSNDERAPQLVIDGKVHDRVPAEAEWDDWRCTDCDALEGEIHELGCSQETCPECGEQLIGCGHVTDPHDEE